MKENIFTTNCRMHKKVILQLLKTRNIQQFNLDAVYLLIVTENNVFYEKIIIERIK